MGSRRRSHVSSQRSRRWGIGLYGLFMAGFFRGAGRSAVIAVDPGVGGECDTGQHDSADQETGDVTDNERGHDPGIDQVRVHRVFLCWGRERVFRGASVGVGGYRKLCTSSMGMRCFLPTVRVFGNFPALTYAWTVWTFRWSASATSRVVYRWGRSGIAGLSCDGEVREPLGDSRGAGLAVRGGTRGLHRFVVALQRESDRLATVGVRGGRAGCPASPLSLRVLLGCGCVQVVVQGVHRCLLYPFGY